MQIYLRLPRRSIFGVSQSSIKPSAMQIYLRLLRRSIFGVSQSTIKRGQKQTRLHFADPLLRKAEAEIPVAVQTPAPSIRRTSSRQSELLRGQKVR